MITESIKGQLQLIYPIFYVMFIVMVASCVFQIKLVKLFSPSLGVMRTSYTAQEAKCICDFQFLNIKKIYICNVQLKNKVQDIFNLIFFTDFSIRQ